LYLSHFVFTRRQMGRHEISVELYTYFVWFTYFIGMWLKIN
jgi:hypothetical protein